MTYTSSSLALQTIDLREELLKTLQARCNAVVAGDRAAQAAALAVQQKKARDAVAEHKCGACYDRSADMCFMTCMHVALCEECSNSDAWKQRFVVAGKHKCPVCRQMSKLRRVLYP